MMASSRSRRKHGETLSVQKRDTARIAACGMYLAAAELCRQGFNVTPTSRNMAGADLFITDDQCQVTWSIQVKVTDQSKKRRRGWLLGSHTRETVSPTHAYVFVVINGSEPSDFYVVPSAHVAENQKGAASMPEFRKDGADAFKGAWHTLRGQFSEHATGKHGGRPEVRLAKRKGKR